jgi:hypothetical protein
MTKFEELSNELFGDPKTAISDIHLFRGEDPNASIEDIAGSILAAIRDIRAGGGRNIDLSY